VRSTTIGVKPYRASQYASVGPAMLAASSVDRDALLTAWT
jgi:hypothetical protein